MRSYRINASRYIETIVLQGVRFEIACIGENIENTSWESDYFINKGGKKYNP
jgi:hypothetical protein